jgi:L-alanine-DL-glutamate epimerase-like enolase superfamily enzyme
MKITSVEVIPVQVPMAFAYGEATTVPSAIARIRTDEGIEGLGHVTPLYGRQFRSLVSAIEELAEQLVGEDPRAPERIHRKILADGIGLGGTGNLAAAALDVAVWDAAAKAVGLPLYRMLGGYRNHVPVYASLRLGRALKTAELPPIAESLLEQGFRAMKMNLGGQADVDGDVERVRLVRQTIGWDVKLLADVNSRWTPSEAIRAARLIEEFRLFWLEDPVPLHNLEGMAEVHRAIDTPVANGETLFSLSAFRTLFEARAVDYPMPDLARVGGITPFLKIAHLAESFNLPVACHLLPEISGQVVAAVPNGVIVEYVPFGEQVFQGCPEIRDGELHLSERPGTGMTLDEAFVKQHRLD